MVNVGDSISAGNASWTFGDEVSKTFDEHVRKSVPLYDVGHDLITKVSDHFLSDGSICYDLGCSTGTLLKKLADHNQAKKVDFRGFDYEESMIEKANDNCKDYNNISLQKGDVRELELEPSDMITSYYTIQFIHPKSRQLVFDKIYDSLNWGGAFLLFEKVRASDARFQDIATALYTDYKIDQGFSPDEIVAKTRSLKGVLEPFSTQGNRDLLDRSGFKDVMTLFKYVCFEGFLAIK